MNELLCALRERVRQITLLAAEGLDAAEHRVARIDRDAWKRLTAIQADLSDYICEINTPE